MRHSCIATSLGALVVLAGTAAAEPDHAPAPRRHGSLTALAGSDVGLDVAFGLQLELPIPIRLTGTAGWLPGGYAWILDKYYTDVFGGRPAIGELIKETVKNALVVRGMLGARLARGLFIDATYTFIRSDKDGLVAGVIESASGLGLREQAPFTNTFETKVRSHMAGAQVGWQWGRGPGFSLRASIGFVTLVHTSATFEPNFVPRDPATTDRIIQAAEARLRNAGNGTTAPIGSLFLGYTF